MHLKLTHALNTSTKRAIFQLLKHVPFQLNRLRVYSIEFSFRNHSIHTIHIKNWQLFVLYINFYLKIRKYSDGVTTFRKAFKVLDLVVFILN